MGAGTLLSAAGQMGAADVYSAQAGMITQQANISARAAEINAQVSEWEAGSYQRIGTINSLAAEADALSVEKATLRTVRQARREFSSFQGSQVSRYAAAGFGPGQGLSEILDEGNDLFEEDLAALMEDGALEASRIRMAGKASSIQSSMYTAGATYQAALGRISASQIKLSGEYNADAAEYKSSAASLGAISSLLTGAGNIGMNFYRPGKAA